VSAWRRRLHRLRVWLQALVAAAIIALAVVVGFAQLALPWFVAHPDRIGAFLSERLHRPVRIDRVEGRWERDGPVLALRGVHIDATDAAQATTIPQAELKINFFAALYRNLAWNELRLVGLELHLTRTPDGAWQVQGMETGGAGDHADASALFALGSLVLRDLRLTIDDADRHLVLGGDEVRLINSGNRHRVLARVRCLETNSAPVEAVIDYDDEQHDGEIYLGGRALDLAAILHGYALAGLTLERGNGRAQVWAWWRHDRLTELRAEADLRDLVLSTAAPVPLGGKPGIVPRVGFDRIGFAAAWRRTEHGWRADVADLVFARQGATSPAARIHVEKSRDPGDAPPVYALAVEALDLAGPTSVAMLCDALPETARRWLYQADPIGTLETLTLRHAGATDFDVSARFEGLAWHAVDAVPGVSGARGALLGDQDAFVLSLPPHTAFGFDAPKVFRRPFEFAEFAGDVAAYRGERGWRLETDALDFDGAGYGGQLRGAIELHDDGSRPALDVYAVVTHGEVPASHLFWPVNVLPPPAVAWLDRALEAGNVKAGRAVFRGDLADWPFHDLAGRFEARAEVEDVRLVYLPDWPVAERIRAVADFVNAGLHVDASAAEVLGNKVDKASADIPDLAEPVLDLDLTGAGAGKDLLGFIKATPIGQRYGAELLGVGLGGSGKVAMHLTLPIKQVERLELAGTVKLADADVSDAKYNLRLTKANGGVRFSQRGFASDPLAVNMNGKPATFALAVGGMTADPKHAVEATLAANLPARELLAYAPLLTAYADRVDGATLWNIGFSADSDLAAAPTTRLSVEADLHGVALDLPAPLAKTADSALPLKLVLGPPAPGGAIDLSLGRLMHLRGRLPAPNQPFAARVEFGGEATAPLPAAGFLIGGSAPLLDLSGWLDFASGSGGGSDLLAGVDLKTQSLMAWQRDFGAATFRLTPAREGLELAFAGANIDGGLSLPSDLRQRGISAHLTRLYWPEATDTETTSVSENPASLPPLHIRIDDFHLGQSSLGATTLESYPVANGTHFEQVATHSSNLEMRARGDWLGRPGSDRSTFVIDFSARDLGRMLDAFGYAGVVIGGETVAHIEGSWPGAPATFALARLDGTLKASVRAGRIPEADPGAGRIFGLFNLGALPRRLALDFGDFFRSGFSFDSIEGTFTLKDGNAYTSGLTVTGPAADIEVSGRTGLKARDYDQTMLVTPHVGGTLMIGGALVGGPVGAAAGAVLQGVFENQIASAVRARYSVKGGWDKPVITLLAKEPVESTQPASPPARPAPKPKPAPASGGGLRGAGL
jgi:uncharacterized protein (TIGR02099 family)